MRKIQDHLLGPEILGSGLKSVTRCSGRYMAAEKMMKLKRQLFSWPPDHSGRGRLRLPETAGAEILWYPEKQATF
jgi:hypothetical protein